MNQRPLQAIDYLCEEKRVLREPLGDQLVRLCSIKESCLERMIFFGAGSLRKGIHEFVAHYHGERNHQDLANRLIIPDQSQADNSGMIQRKERLGGMLNSYFRRAA